VLPWKEYSRVRLSIKVNLRRKKETGLGERENMDKEQKYKQPTRKKKDKSYISNEKRSGK